MTLELKAKEKEALNYFQLAWKTHAAHRTNLARGHALEVLQLKKDLKILPLDKQEALKELE